ncbi:MAG: hypothetical protein RMY62_008270 [Nostoc sp. ZfuVER08]|jgi:hypothetical protein|uniref:hypothetical protein n=1 Tax=Nostoc punctiforme TaxID=272131 RepID=UPI001F54BBD7|nr:hypothetical protein [Nostoc punctiforme]MDZ8014965.1 hypothetical protein [Nostoc sp. ZfuVER08]
MPSLYIIGGANNFGKTIYDNSGSKPLLVPASDINHEAIILGLTQKLSETLISTLLLTETLRERRMCTLRPLRFVF